MRASVRDSGASEAEVVVFDKEVGAGSLKVTPIPCAASTELPVDVPPQLVPKQLTDFARPMNESHEAEHALSNHVSSEISAQSVSPAPTDLHIMSHDDPTLKAADTVEESSSTSDLVGGATSVEGAEPDVSIVNGTIVWYRCVTAFVIILPSMHLFFFQSDHLVNTLT